MSMSNFTNFADGVSIRGVPVLQLHPGKVFWVGNSTTPQPDGAVGNDSRKGSFQQPLGTINQAINLCVSGRGDIIAVQPGHAETISTAAGIAMSKSGVALIGVGNGALQPTLSFSATASTMTVAGNNCTIKNIKLLLFIHDV